MQRVAATVAFGDSICRGPRGGRKHRFVVRLIAFAIDSQFIDGQIGVNAGRRIVDVVGKPDTDLIGRNALIEFDAESLLAGAHVEVADFDAVDFDDHVFAAFGAHRINLDRCRHEQQLLDWFNVLL